MSCVTASAAAVPRTAPTDEAYANLVDERLKLAGLRLAALPNEVLAAPPNL